MGNRKPQSDFRRRTRRIRRRHHYRPPNFGTRRVNRAFCAIGSFDLAFLDTDHHVQQVGIDLQEPELVSERGEFGVRIRGRIILRDQGRFDDRYRGQVRFIIFADLADA